MNILKEACVEGFIQAYGAEKAGAGRIELCENLAVGGTTPSIGTVKMCKKYMHIPVVAMIRPRGGDFVYSPREIENMAYDIEAFRDAGVDGIAIGILTSKNEVDLNTLSTLLKKAGEMQVTFHKAIDVTENIEAEFLKLCCSGLITRVLTSGGAETAAEGAGTLKKLVEIANERVAVVVAGKVTFENINELSRIIPAREFHGKKIVGDLL